MPFSPKAPIDLALQERIRIAYYEEQRPIAEVEEVAGVARGTLYRWFRSWGWPLRKPMRARRGGGPIFRLPGQEAAASAYPSRGTGPQSPIRRESLKARLQRLVEHRVAILEHEAMAGVPVDAAAVAVAIERNARTLAALEKLDGEAALCPQCASEPPARSLSELRDELRRHLERLRQERCAARGFQPDDDEVLPPDGAVWAEPEA